MHYRIRPVKNFYLFFIFFSGFYSAYTQDSVSIPQPVVLDAAASIDSTDLKKYLTVISADSLEGRETGEAGQKKAAHFIRSIFMANGIEPVVIKGEKTYYQKFNLYKEGLARVSVVISGNEYRNYEDIIYTGTFDDSIATEISVVFAGYGEESDFAKLKRKGEGVVIISSGDYSDQIACAGEHGFKYIFFINEYEAFRRMIGLYSNYYTSSGVRFEKNEKASDEEHIIFIHPAIASHIFDVPFSDLEHTAQKSKSGKKRALSKIKPAGILYKAKKDIQTIRTENVLGIVKGTEKPEEIIVISAHYDHLGKEGDMIYNGADDNGSGTVTLLELAKAFSITKKLNIGPKRSVMFIAFTGEEMGLLGSEYYSENPVFPLSKKVANFNIDMVGRADYRYANDSAYVYIIGSDKISEELHHISENTNQTYTNLILDYTYNDENDPNNLYYRSDHYNFARHNIPVIFYFTGLHNDYHKPTDTIEKIRFKNMERIGKLIFLTAWEVANREGRISVK